MRATADSGVNHGVRGRDCPLQSFHWRLQQCWLSSPILSSRETVPV